MITWVRAGLVPAYMVLCLLLGGSSVSGPLANAALQLLALPILFWAVVARQAPPPSAAERQLLWLAALSLCLVALQLVPMPPAIWSLLPGREPVILGYDLLGRPAPWLPLSLAPHQTVSAALRILPPLAVAVCMIRLGGYDGRWIAWTICLGAVSSVLLGFLQLSGGPAGPWRVYDRTSDGMVGFFSNSNHLAILLVTSVAFAAALIVRPPTDDRRKRPVSILPVVMLGVIGVAATGVALIPSMAGRALLLLVGAGSFLALVPLPPRARRWAAASLGLGAVAAALLALTGLASNLIGEATSSALPRYESFSITAKAAADYFPAGSGLGTFQEIYRTYEDPAMVHPTYINHAHNDYLELALETGAPGLGLLLVFFLWWLRQAKRVFSSGSSETHPRAAVIASGAIMLHTLVDYPIRTGAIAAIFAASCVLMAKAVAETAGRAASPD